MSGAFGATAAAGSTPEPESRQLYFAEGNGWSIAFASEAGRVTVLGLDATVYCEELEPLEGRRAALDAFFALPTTMRGGPHGLVAVERDGFGSTGASVQASLEGGKIVGKFEYVNSLQSSHCQTGGYYAEPAPVPFEAARYVPVASPEATLPTTPGESGSAFYFSVSGALEIYLRVARDRIFVRGEVTSECRFGNGPPGTDQLFPGPTVATLDERGRFVVRRRFHGPIRRGATYAERILLSGRLDEASIEAHYSRAFVARRGKWRRSCEVDSGALVVARYLPAKR